MKTFKEFLEDTFAAGIAANSIGNGTAIQGFDPLMKKAKKRMMLTRLIDNDKRKNLNFRSNRK